MDDSSKLTEEELQKMVEITDKMTSLLENAFPGFPEQQLVSIITAYIDIGYSFGFDFATLKEAVITTLTVVEKRMNDDDASLGLGKAPVKKGLMN